MCGEYTGHVGEYVIKPRDPPWKIDIMTFLVLPLFSASGGLLGDMRVCIQRKKDMHLSTASAAPIFSPPSNTYLVILVVSTVDALYFGTIS